MFLPAQRLPARTPAPAREHRAQAAVPVLKRPCLPPLLLRAWLRPRLQCHESLPGAAPQGQPPHACRAPQLPGHLELPAALIVRPQSGEGQVPGAPSPAMRCPCCRPHAPGRGGPTKAPTAPDAIQRARGHCTGLGVRCTCPA